MSWLFNDGGRAAAGYVGLVGDCVPRAIAIATGRSYRSVYEELKSTGQSSPRDGVYPSVSFEVLSNQGWIWHREPYRKISDIQTSNRVYIVSLVNRRGRGHLTTVIDGTVHDTWNAADDDEFKVRGYWLPPGDGTTIPEAIEMSLGNGSDETQVEYEKALRRLRALNSTANNHASTEHEQHNALRMMQTLMLRHNLSLDDLVDKKQTDDTLFTRIACALNGRRACGWESDLAFYVTQQVFPNVQYFRGTNRNRTLFWFYGPWHDVENSILLFRELLITVAASARLKYGGYARGSGASYAEGFVAGLPKFSDSVPNASAPKALSRLHERSLIVHRLAKLWLNVECDIQLSTTSGSGRYAHDRDAAQAGRADGSKQEINPPQRNLRLPLK